MEFTVKSLAGEISENEKKVVRKKMLWFEEHLPSNAQMVVGVRQHITKKSNQAFEIIVRLSSVSLRNPIYIKTVNNDLADGLDVLREKLERIVLKKKDKRKFKLKLPRINFKKDKKTE